MLGESPPIIRVNPSIRRCVLAGAVGALAVAAVLLHQISFSVLDRVVTEVRPETARSSVSAGNGLRDTMEAQAENANSSSITQFVDSLNESELESILRERATFFPDGMSHIWRRALLARWVTFRPVAAANHARVSDPAGIPFVLDAWFRVDAVAAAAWLREFGDRRLAEVIFQQDAHESLPPGAALALFEKLPADTEAALGIDLIARASREEINSWLLESSQTPLRHRALIHFSQINPEQARETILEAARDLPEGPERQQLLNVIIGQWARNDPVSAVAWLDELPDARSYVAVWASLTAQWAEAHPAQAAQIAVQLPSGPAQHQAVISAVSGWARLDPAGASAWVIQFPEGSLRSEAVQQLVFAWSLRDAAAAERWMSLLPHGPSRDAAVKTFQAFADRDRTAKGLGAN